MIVALTYFTSLMVVLTKWLDCTTTFKHINGIAMESNPIARALMYRFGIKGTVWFAFIVSIDSKHDQPHSAGGRRQHLPPHT